MSCTQGSCDGGGACIAEVGDGDQDGDGIHDGQDRVGGLAFWVEAPQGPVELWYGNDEIELLLSESERVLVLPAEQRLDLSKVELAVTPGPEAAPRRPRGSANTLGRDHAGGERHGRGVPGRAPGRRQPIPTLELQCAGRSTDVMPTSSGRRHRMSIDEVGRIVVRGSDLEYAWLPSNSDADIRRRDLPWLMPSLPCRGCRDTPGDFNLGFVHLETCNGFDDDEDGHIDEGALCDELLPCTRDRCEGSAGCSHTPRDTRAFCTLAGDCVQYRCGTPLTPSSNQDPT